jgi:DNA invertase Pin-like site-specific DNA recombinase
MATAYSYLRFSSPDQADGDSARRQNTLRDRWLQQHTDVRLAEPMKDEGSSAYHGHHLKEGHPLAKFLRDVERGRIPGGSFLIVEALDRLSRENPWDAVPLLCSIVNAGITVVTLSPHEVEYRRGNDLTPLVLAVVELSRGHSESQMKAKRLGEVWGAKKERAREDKMPMGKHCPAWLELADGVYRRKPDAARAVKLMFRWCAEGLGKEGIARRLTKEGVPAIGPSGRWSGNYVMLVLRGRAALGEYQPTDRRGGGRVKQGDPVPGYYPAIITEREWRAIQFGSS